MNFTVLPGSLAIVRLAPADPIPPWAEGGFISITRTADELSIVCDETRVGRDVRADCGWRALKIEGPLPLTMTGVVSRLTTALAASGISVFVVATFDTDYILVKEERLEAACEALRSEGSRFTLRRAGLPRSFTDDVRGGLARPRKQLQPWFFYDALGSALFAAICELPEYYVTRAEVEILSRHGAEIARAFRQPQRLIEFGPGNARKTRLLLAPDTRLTYVPIDIDPTMLESAAHDLLLQFPSLRIEAVCGDYRDASRLIAPGGRTAVLFLGSSIGNLDMNDAASMLRDARRMLNPGDSLLLGADLRKPKEIVEPAYDDALGITAAFNKNLLARINRELGGTFDVSKFDHRAFFNEAENRIEMHLVSRERQSVRIESLQLDVRFEKGETIHTENSYKYAEADLRALAREGGFEIETVWTDARHWFADVLMVAM